MTGSEWFGTRAGGLNRYFESLFKEMSSTAGVAVNGSAFGQPPARGRSWGPVEKSLPSRVVASRLPLDLSNHDVIDRHFAPYGLATPRTLKSKASVVHFHGPWFAESLATGQTSLNARSKRQWEARRYASADAVVVLSEPFAELLMEQFGTDPDRIHVIPPGVDLERFSLADAPRPRPRVLCVRRLERRMGLDTLLEAWPAVVAAVAGAQLDIVGTGTEEDALRGHVLDRGLSSSVKMHGRVGDEELVALYGEATLSVVPTRELEGFGLIALESLAMGTPVVVTRCGGLPDSVVGLDPSLVVPIGDVEALASRLVRALQGDIPTHRACRTHAETFTWGRCAQRHKDLYRGLV